MNWPTWADRSADICSRTDAWDSTACGLLDVRRAPIEDMVPFSYAVVAIAAIWARMEENLAWSAASRWSTTRSRCLALATCCAASSYCCTAWSICDARRLTDFCTCATVGCGAAPAGPVNVARAPAAIRPTVTAALRRTRDGVNGGRVLTSVTGSFSHFAYQVS